MATAPEVAPLWDTPTDLRSVPVVKTLIAPPKKCWKEMIAISNIKRIANQISGQIHTVAHECSTSMQELTWTSDVQVKEKRIPSKLSMSCMAHNKA